MITDKKFEDPFDNKPKFFETIEHDSQLEKTRSCIRCKVDIAEKSMIEKRKTLSDNTKRKINDVEYTLQKMTVHRGRLDDCIGWSFSWS